MHQAAQFLNVAERNTHVRASLSGRQYPLYITMGDPPGFPADGTGFENKGSWGNVYRTSNGIWRMAFNIFGEVTSTGSFGSFVINVFGVNFNLPGIPAAATSLLRQAVSVFDSSGATNTMKATAREQGQIVTNFNGVKTIAQDWAWMGDVALGSRPTFAVDL